MDNTLFELLPNAENFLQLEPEELAGVVLAWLKQWETTNRGRSFYRELLTYEGLYEPYPEGFQTQLRRAVMEAWVWLAREGFIAPDSEWRAQTPGQDPYFVTRRGQRVNTAEDVAAYRRASVLPQQLLHPVIARRVWADFLRGDYTSAVSKAFKAVEVAVREASKLGEGEHGTGLMRKAFAVNAGPLANQKSLPAEQQGVSDLFAGAFGCVRNPATHRDIEFEPGEAAERIMLASLLLNFVDVATSTEPATAQ